MAKFRSNHSRQNSGKGKDTVVKVGIFGAIMGALFYIFNFFSGTTDTSYPEEETTYFPEKALPAYLPTGTTGEIIQHQYYTLSYNEAAEQAEWVAYILEKDSLANQWVKRHDQFMPDPNVSTESANTYDYRNSGYDRGHLVPAADMAFNEVAMMETFFMSNISPQSRDFNKGIWRELEELTRNWAKKFGDLYIVTGPVLEDPKGYIGENQIVIPSSYFKVILDLNEPETKAIAFYLPNEISYEPLFRYAISVDELEELTGIDFFTNLLSTEAEEALESRFNIDLWQFSKKKYNTRVNKWNKPN